MIQVYEYKGNQYTIRQYCHVKDSVNGWQIGVMYSAFDPISTEKKIGDLVYVRTKDDFDLKFVKIN